MMTRRKTAIAQRRRGAVLLRQAKKLPAQEKDLTKLMRQLIHGHQTSTLDIKTALLTVQTTDTPFKAMVKETAIATSTKKRNIMEVKRAKRITHNSMRGQTTTAALRNG